MTIRETFMQRCIMGLAMTVTAFPDGLMAPFMTVHTLQFTVFAGISLLGASLLSMTAAAQFGGHFFRQLRRHRRMVFMTFETVIILHAL
jgi:putative Mn2+ efflux pump MntP